MSVDTTYQRAKIIVEETRKLYFQIIFFIGLFLVILIRTTLIGGTSAMSSFSFIEGNVSYSLAGNSLVEYQLFIFLYIVLFFIIILGYKYLKFYNLKRNFNNEQSSIKMLKKYMKMDEIPSKKEIEDKFNVDKDKSKKKFYMLVIRVIILNIVLYFLYINYLDNSALFNLVLFFSVLTLVYRYFMVFHVDKKLFNQKWEDKKIKEYMD